MTDNMKLWDEVSRTNPEFTKKVTFGRNFTAIDAHYQIMEATRAFGPIGEGWGYDAGAPIFTPDSLIIIPVSLWHGSRDNVFGPQYGSAAIKTVKDGKERIDSDAPKKAETDAITKLLSHLGFNADVFLKKFDDNKYVEQMKQEFAPKPDLATPEQIDQIKVLAPTADVQPTAIIESFNVKSMKELTQRQAENAIKRLNKTIEDKQQKDAA